LNLFRKKVIPTVDLLKIDDDYLVIGSNATVMQAAEKIRDSGIPDMVVVDDQKGVLGIASDFDICTKVVAAGRDPKTTKVTEAMYAIEPVSPTTTVIEAFKHLRKNKAPVVPVVGEGKLLGVVTLMDCWPYLPDEAYKE